MNSPICWSAAMLVAESALWRKEEPWSTCAGGFPERHDETWCKHTLQHREYGITEERVSIV